MKKVLTNLKAKTSQANKKIVAICAAMKTGTGLSLFAECFPNRIKILFNPLISDKTRVPKQIKDNEKK